MNFLQINKKANVTNQLIKKYLDNQDIQYSNLTEQNQDQQMVNDWKIVWNKLNAQNPNQDNLYQSLNIAFKKRIIFTMVLSFIYYQSTLMIPLLAFYIFQHILDNSYSSSQNIILVVAVISIKCIKPFIRIWSEKRMWEIGQTMQAIISKQVINKAFKVSFLSNKSLQSSQIDMIKIAGFLFYRSYVWFNTYGTIFNIVLIIYLFGFAGFLGILTLIFTLVLRFCFKRTIDKYQQQLDIETSNRVKKTIDILNIIKFIKVSALQIPYMKKLYNLRQRQLQTLYSKNQYELIPLFALAASVRIVILVIMLVLIAKNQPFNSGIAFTLNFIFVNLNFQYIFMHLTNLNQSKMAMKNIAKFLMTQEINNSHIVHKNEQRNQMALVIKNGNFYWERQMQNQVINQIPTISLKDINLNVKKGEFIGIVGKFSCGKSSLFNAILGQMKNSGKSLISINGSVAYVSQKSWILNDSVRNNILFGNQYNQSRYSKAIHYSCLKQDLQILSDGDKTVIGQRGCTLSGGQKARISLARALYSNAQIYLLDDILSAVDAHVGSFIFFQTLTKYLQGKTILLITHSLNFIEFTHRIFIIDNFKMIQTTKIDQIKQYQIPSSKQLGLKRNENKVEFNYSNNNPSKQINAGFGKKFQFAVNQFIKRCGGLKFKVTSITLILFTIISSIIIIFWINYWTYSPNYKDSLFVYIYLLIVAFSALVLILVWYYISHLPILFDVYKDMVKGLLFTSLSYFQTTHIAKIIHGLSNDLNKLDKIVLIQYWSFVSHFGLMLNFAFSIFYIYIYNEHYLILLIFTLYLVAVIYKQMRYILAMQAYGEVEDQLRITINSFFTESVQGQSTIRAYDKQKQRMHSFSKICNKYAQIYLTVKGIYLIIKFLLSITSALYLSFVLIFYFTVQTFSNFQIFSLVSILSLQQYLDRYNQNIVQFLVKLKYLSKCQEFASIQPEAGYQQLMLQIQQKENIGTINQFRLSKNIFTEGSIQFKNVSVRYKAQNQNVLKNISIQMRGGEKVGIVGRTGSGKSTLFLALLRILQAYKGKIFIDGTDISAMDLDILRKNINFILQDHFLFAGTVRENIDPSQQHSDQSIQQVLKLCNIWKNLQKKQRLETIVAQGGQNFSIGERQLLNIARSLLSRKKIVLVDEATANIDPQTDQIIQKVLNNHFRQCTMLTIAHRINTVINCDRILVLQEGQIKQFDSPSKLMMNQASLFRKLYDQSTKIKIK